MTGVALTGTLLRRHRLGVPLTLGYLALFCALLATLGNNPGFATVLALGTMFAVVGVLYLITVFIHPDSDVASSQSTYPKHYFVLPVSSFQLVFWPMLLAVVVMSVVFCGVAWSARNAGQQFDAVALSLMASALVCMLQAIYWTPLGVPYSKLFLTVVACYGVGLVAVNQQSWNIDAPQLNLIFGGLIVASFLVALAGVARARLGDVPTLRSSDRASPLKAGRLKLKNARIAQLWFEWRQQGAILPIIALVCALLFQLPLYWEEHLVPMYGFRRSGIVMEPSFPAYFVAFLPLLAVILPVSAWMVGCGARASDIKRGDGSFQLYFATRPMSDWALSSAKLWTSLRSVSIAWAVFLLACTPMLLMRAGYPELMNHVDHETRAYKVLIDYLTPDLLLVWLSWLVIVVFWTWRNYVVGIWTDLTGHRWIKYGYPIGVAFLIVFYLSWQAAQEEKSSQLSFLCWAAWTAVVIKLLSGVGLMHRNLATGVVTAKTVGKLAAYYVGSVALWGGAWYLAIHPIYVQGPANESALDGMITSIEIACVLLWVPLVRLLLVPMALSANRHR